MVSHFQQAVVASTYGPPLDVLSIKHISVGNTTAGHASIRMIASPINPSDLIPITGAYRSRTELPFIPGFEGVGVIEDLHPEYESEFSELSVGSRVIPIGTAGGWQQVKNTALSWCIPVPDDISNQQAATAYINPVTAVRMIHEHAMSQHIGCAVISAAGSAIAHTLAHLLQLKGIKTIGLFRQKPTSIDTEPWDEIVSTSAPGWARYVHDILRPELGFDCVGGKLGTELAHTLSFGGALVHYGLLSGQPLAPELWNQRPDLTIELFRLRDWIHTAPRHDVRLSFTQVFEHIRNKIVDTTISDEMPLSQFKTGIQIASTQAAQGKILLRPN